MKIVIRVEHEHSLFEKHKDRDTYVFEVSSFFFLIAHLSEACRGYDKSTLCYSIQGRSIVLNNDRDHFSFEFVYATDDSLFLFRFCRLFRLAVLTRNDVQKTINICPYSFSRYSNRSRDKHTRNDREKKRKSSIRRVKSRFLFNI